MWRHRPKNTRVPLSALSHKAVDSHILLSWFTKLPTASLTSLYPIYPSWQHVTRIQTYWYDTVKSVNLVTIFLKKIPLPSSSGQKIKHTVTVEYQWQILIQRSGLAEAQTLPSARLTSESGFAAASCHGLPMSLTCITSQYSSFLPHFIYMHWANIPHISLTTRFWLITYISVFLNM